MMALRKVGVLRTIYIVLNLSVLFGIVFTQDDMPQAVAEHVEYQSPNEDGQPLHAIDPFPTEILEQPVVALHQPDPNDIDKASNVVDEPPNAVNQAPEEPAIVNQDTDVLNQAPNLPNQASSEAHEPPNVMPGASVTTSHIINQPPIVDNQPPIVDNQPPIVDNQPPRVDNQPPIVDNQPPIVDNQPPRADNQPPRVDSQHRPSTVDFDYGNVESLEMNDDFQGLPGVQHEFRIEVAAGKSECIYQRLPENAKLHVSYQVLRGMDRNIEFLIQGPSNFILEHVPWSSDASLEKNVPFEGLYRFCMKNELSKFSSKLVYFYMVTYIEEKWHQHSKNILEFFEGAEDIQKSLDMVDERMKKIHLEQASSRRNVISDWYLIQDNNSYIQIMSLIFCVVIVVSSAFQVFFVRHLFSVRNVNPKSKPRA